MSNVLQQLELRRHRTTVLRSGLKVGFHYPDVQECILKVGKIPLGALKDATEITEEQAAELIAKEPAAINEGLAFTKLVVAAMLDDIDGEAIEAGDDRMAIVDAFEPEERQELFLIGTREKDPDSGEA